VICFSRLIMPALQFATATANLASQNAFLFLATHGPIFILLCHSESNPLAVWIPVSPLTFEQEVPKRLRGLSGRRRSGGL
jgi:hypothetical protein